MGQTSFSHTFSTKFTSLIPPRSRSTQHLYYADQTDINIIRFETPNYVRPFLLQIRKCGDRDSKYCSYLNQTVQKWPPGALTDHHYLIFLYIILSPCNYRFCTWKKGEKNYCRLYCTHGLLYVSLGTVRSGCTQTILGHVIVSGLLIWHCSLSVVKFFLKVLR